LLEETLDDGRIHRFSLVHSSDFGSDDILSESSNCEKKEERE